MLTFHSGDLHQRGQGLGTFFSGLLKAIIPVAKSFLTSSTGKNIQKIALTTAGNVAQDLIQGKNVKDTAQQNLVNAKNKIGSVLKRKFGTDSPPSSPPTKRRRGRKKKKKIVGSKVGKFNLLDE